MTSIRSALVNSQETRTISRFRQVSVERRYFGINFIAPHVEHEFVTKEVRIACYGAVGVLLRSTVSSCYLPLFLPAIITFYLFFFPGAGWLRQYSD
jgi:hypothetical protein